MSKTQGAALLLVFGGLLSACGGEIPDDTSSEPGAGAAATDDENISVDGSAIDSKAQVRAGNGETGYHFVQISTHGAPRWSAYVDETLSNGKVINSHSQGTRTGGKVNFWFWTYPGTHYHVHIWGLGNSVDWYYDNTTVDHCFQTDAVGTIRDKGTSDGGGCNSH